MIVETVVDVMSKQNTAHISNALILMEVGMEQHALNNNNNWRNNWIITGSATQDWLTMDIVLASITWTAKMIVDTVADVMSKQNTAQIANALLLMEVGMEQHALNNINNNNWWNNSSIAGSMQPRID